MSVVQTDHTSQFRESEARPRVETYSYVKRPMVSAVTPAVLPLFSFSADGEVRRLRNPLLLRISVEDGEYFVENDSLRIFGHGSTLEAAMKVFVHDLAYFWHYYRSLSNDEVMGGAVELKRIYEDLIA